jgi:type IV pilus assembly protein PilE
MTTRHHRIGDGRETGFTLIEVMMVLAVVTILTTIALPSYSNYLARVNRSAAAQFMLDVANRQEQYLIDQRSYAAFTCSTTCTGSLGVRPEASVSRYYTFTSVVSGNDCLGNALAGPSFVITATPVGSQASDGALCIDSRNNKTPSTKWEG